MPIYVQERAAIWKYMQDVVCVCDVLVIVLMLA